MIKYISQTPLIPIIISGLITLLIIMQCFTKRKFLRVRLILSCIFTFCAVLFFVFYDEITSSSKEIYLTLTYFAMLAIEAASLILLFTTLDFSMTNEKFQKTLTESLDQSKFFVFLDRKDKVKTISTCLLTTLGIEENEALGKNFFDVVERKYRIVGLNSETALKDDVKAFFSHYDKKVTEGQKGTLELNIQEDDGREGALYFTEDPIFSSGKYRGRILLGEMKGNESLMGMEKELSDTKNELELIRNQFTAVLYKTHDGIFFNSYDDKSIWFNDILVEKLCLNGNSMGIQDFYKNMHPEDTALYENALNHTQNGDYEVTYRYNNGSYYVYVKETGQKIMVNGGTQFAGIMTVYDDYHFEKTNTALDSVGTEAEMQSKYKQLLNEENNVFMVAYFRIDSVPEINEKFGRPIGNMMLSEYIAFFKKSFLTNNYIFRLSGLEFVAFITNYNRIEALKSALRNDEKILHISANYANEKIATEVYMGISFSNDTTNRKDTLKNAKDALRICKNPQYNSSYAFYKDVK